MSKKEPKQVSNSSAATDTATAEAELIEIPIGQITEEGKLEIAPAIQDEIIKALIEIETARIVCEAHGKRDEAASLETERMILGLDEYIPPPVSATTEPGSDTPKKPEKDPTLEITEENYLMLQEFLDRLRGKLKITLTDSEIAEILHRKRNEIKVRKSIAQGGIKVVPKKDDPTKNHILSPHIQHIHILNPEDTRLLTQKLKINPAQFPHSVNITDDSYFCQIRIKISGFEGKINAFITPPHWNVYIVGEDPKNTDKFYLALVHILLDSFHTAVGRIYDPSKKEEHDDSNNANRPFDKKIREAISEIAQGTFPVLVTDFEPDPADDEITGDLTPDPDSGETKTGGWKALHKRFDKIADLADGEAVYIELADQCLCIRAPDIARVLYNHRTSLLPARVWLPDGTQSVLKQGENYESVYVPLRDAAMVKEVIDFLVNEHNFKDDSLRNVALPKIFVGKLANHPSDPGKAFEETLREKKHSTRMNHYLAGRCDTLFADADKSINNWAELFNHVFKQARKFDPAVTPQEVFEAFTSLCPLNPEKIFIPKTGVTDYRLPYRFKDDSQIPPEIIFDSPGRELNPQTPMDVVKIIAANRAKIDRVYRESLRQDNRRDGMTLAEELQRQYRLATSGTQVDLTAVTRALLVYKFEGKDGGELHAYTYLDESSDSRDPKTLQVIKAEDRLMNQTPRVINTIQKTMTENKSSIHSDFSSRSGWKDEELLRLERKGVIGLNKDPQGNITGISWSLTVIKKKIVIFKYDQTIPHSGECIGYRQFETSNLFAYFEYLKSLDPDFPLQIDTHTFDWKKLVIQKAFYDAIEA